MRRSALLFVALAFVYRPAHAEPVRYTLPFRVAHGQPSYEEGSETACYLWLAGGRVHLRMTPGMRSHRVKGELRTSDSGFFEDVAPLSERLVPHQSSPAKLAFDARLTTVEEGLDVTLSGDYAHLTIDLLIDGTRAPHALRIGAHQESPPALPVRLRLRAARRSLRDRLGF